MNIGNVFVDIKKSNRKTVSIYIERDGSVSALVPENLDDTEIHKVLKTKEYQISKHLASWELLNEARVEREYVSGQSFLYLGRNYRLKFIDEPTKTLRLLNGYFILGKSNKPKAKELFVEFYKNKLREKINPIVEHYRDVMNVQLKDTKVMELQNRWASCTNSGTLIFHWKCAMAPIEVINYIVVHELAHLIEPNHSKEFWNIVDKTMLNYDKQLHWLKMNGAGMDL
jgi:predicted metal-dependent hydrolase